MLLEIPVEFAGFDWTVCGVNIEKANHGRKNRYLVEHTTQMREVGRQETDGRMKVSRHTRGRWFDRCCDCGVNRGKGIQHLECSIRVDQASIMKQAFVKRNSYVYAKPHIFYVTVSGFATPLSRLVIHQPN